MEVIPVINSETVSDARQRLRVLQSFSSPISRVHFDVGVPPVSTIRVPLFPQVLTEYADIFSFELHCMVPEELFFSRAHNAPGVKRIYYHLHEIHNMEKFEFCMRSWRKRGIDIGVVVRSTDVFRDIILPKGVRSVLVLSVIPGRAGQKFHARTWKVISFLKEKYPRVILTVDGGIIPAIVKKLASAGVSRVTSATYIWDNKKPEEAYKRLAQI